MCVMANQALEEPGSRLCDAGNITGVETLRLHGLLIGLLIYIELLAT